MLPRLEEGRAKEAVRRGVSKEEVGGRVLDEFRRERVVEEEEGARKRTLVLTYRKCWLYVLHPSR